ncbi:MAG: hypothetical protein RLZZ188_718, partial [Verrucomicrobiota bacterium]
EVLQERLKLLLQVLNAHSFLQEIVAVRDMLSDLAVDQFCYLLVAFSHLKVLMLQYKHLRNSVATMRNSL